MAVGGEYHRIKGMGMIMNESAGEGLPDVKNVAGLCCCMTNQGVRSLKEAEIIIQNV